MIAISARGLMPRVDPRSDHRSWGIVVASVEIAENAIPTLAWTAHRTRRPQRPTSPRMGVKRKDT
jgi:hypothetical protein